MTSIPSWLTAIGTLFGGGVFAALIQHLGKKGDQQQVFIDQMQEEVAAARQDAADARKDSADTRKELAALRDQVAQLMTRETLFRWHIDRQDTEITRLGGTPVLLPDQLKEHP